MSEPAGPDSPAEGLKKFSVKEIEDALAFQKERYDWTFFSEREFMENLMIQRFNFLLVFYSLFVAGAASATKQTLFVTVLGVGFLLTLLIWLMLHRAYTKFTIAIKFCYRLRSSPMAMVDEETNHLGWRKLFRVNPLMAIWIPLVCSLSLGAGWVLGLKGLLGPEAR